MLRPVRALVALLSAPALALALHAPAADGSPAKPRPKDPSGHYEGRETPAEANALDTMVYEFDVTGKGRKIKDFTVRFNAVCSYPLGIQYVVQPVGPVKVHPRTGKFRYFLEKDVDGDVEDYRIEVTGRLKGTKVTQGTFSYQVGYCGRGDADDPMQWKAKRTSK